MPIVAYLANQFPSPVEPYVAREIHELRRRGVTVIPCSARRCEVVLDPEFQALASETLYLQPLRLKLLIHAAVMCLLRFPELKDFFVRALWQGSEPCKRRLRTLLHTWLGVYYALRIQRFGVEHIHAHHGYFASWIAMVAARFLGIEFSMTLHGSDLLLHPAYLDTKLKHCKFCVTVSEFNRAHILKHNPDVPPERVVVQYMGIKPGKDHLPTRNGRRTNSHLAMLAVGRLHPVKDHAFLVGACRLLKNRGVPFTCVIAGEGPERASVEALIRNLDLQNEVRLLGHLSQQQLAARYLTADVVVLTSRSEGIPLVLMEAMAYGTPVLAPAITGMPELVFDGKNGFLYRPGSLEDFVARVELILRSESALGPLCRAARLHVLENFNYEKNLATFSNLFLRHLTLTHPSPPPESYFHENSLLQ
jgi:colanic acid/amylovoran biosynthesis glycosyltransferase